MSYQMIALDVAGTTVEDSGVVIGAFTEAFSSIVPQRWATESTQMLAYAKVTMGQSKIEVFTELLGEAELAQQANVAFEEAYLAAIRSGGAHPIAGAEAVFAAARERGIPVVLTTGFSRPTLNALIEALGWQNEVALTVTPSEAGRGRPHADMLEFAAAQLGVTDPETVLVVGDTISDILAGLSFGAADVFGVLSGAHNQDQLSKAGAAEVVNSVADLLPYIQQ